MLAVEAEMARQGIDRKELARRLGCTMQNIEQLLDSERPGINLGTIEKLAAEGLKCGLALFLIPSSLTQHHYFQDTPGMLSGTRIGASAVDQLHRWKAAALQEGLSLGEWFAFAAEIAWNLFHREQTREPGKIYSPLTTAFWVMQGLSPRASHALSLARIRTWEQLEELSLKDISGLPELGVVGARHVKSLLKRRRNTANRNF